VVVNYLKKATPLQKQQFIQAVRKGWVQIDGGHSNINTTTCSDEELLAFFNNSRQIEKVTGVPVTNDGANGCSGCGLGTGAGRCPIWYQRNDQLSNYLMYGNNGNIKPFYWLAPDGKDKDPFPAGFPYGNWIHHQKEVNMGWGSCKHISNSYDRVNTSMPLQNFSRPFSFLMKPLSWKKQIVPPTICLR